MVYRAGGSGYQGYYGSFCSLLDQTSSATPVAMACEETYESAGVTMGADGSGTKNRITFANAGTYNIQFSAQLHHTGGGGSGTTVNIWFRLNGANIANSDTRIDVTTNNPYAVAAWNFIYTVTAGQYIEIVWTTDNTSIILEDVAAAAPAPAIPSIIITAQQVR